MRGPGAPTRRPGGGSSDGVRIWVVTHGPASSHFWAIVRNGVEAAARQMDVLVTYRAPDIYSLRRMEALGGQAVAARPHALVVSVPEPGLAPGDPPGDQHRAPGRLDQLRRRHLPVARRAGAHRPARHRAGLEAGRRLARGGAPRGTDRSRHRARRALPGPGRRHARGRRDVPPSTPPAGRLEPDLDVYPAHERRRRADAQQQHGPGGAERRRAPARTGQVLLGTFDLAPEVLADVRAGRDRPPIPQQAYLQEAPPVVPPRPARALTGSSRPRATRSPPGRTSLTSATPLMFIV